MAFSFAFYGIFFLVLSLVRVNCYSFIFPTVFVMGIILVSYFAQLHYRITNLYVRRVFSNEKKANAGC